MDRAMTAQRNDVERRFRVDDVEVVAEAPRLVKHEAIHFMQGVH